MNHSDHCSWQQIYLRAGSERVLNNLVTCDLNQLTSTPQWSAFCNVKGQVISTTWISQISRGWSVTCAPSLTQILIDHIQHHALRHRFEIEIDPIPFIHPDLKTWSDVIMQGYPYLTDRTSNQYIPQMLDLHHKPQAISWDKGCYLGQEIIMRAQQLGTVKRKLSVGQINQAPKTMTVSDTQGKTSGHILNHSHNSPYLLSMVLRPNESELYCDEQIITLK